MKIITKKEKFFDETLKLISEKGFKATTMRDIAERMDFEVANIYNYIESKDSLLENYLFDVLVDFTEYLDNIVSSSYSPVEKLKLVISRHVQYTAMKPYVISLFVNEWRNLNQPKLKEFEEMRISYMKKVEHLISEGIENGDLRHMNTAFSTFMIFSSMRWLFNMVINENEKINPIEMEKQLMDFIFLGISKQ
ncbi:TetR/AcrR family transcriptional regulator [Arenibacter sp. N53]|uniref:TetR/AcrR family transcriptional regulator n=1 Tax=Arenibacter TaxID=178469 RepID=UPI000CD3F670|nr:MULTISPECIES: TetR/AcrR family transcriptional regulator [Arenibacter]MCM4151186.1 TetR/AcrR family transcriptional regulator [Arenibacter sp. N53]